ncbi:MAG: hypothetical protein RKE49_05715 [Oceanicaulis sp.]
MLATIVVALSLASEQAHAQLLEDRRGDQIRACQINIANIDPEALPRSETPVVLVNFFIISPAPEQLSVLVEARRAIVSSAGSIEETPLDRVTFTDQDDMLFSFECSNIQGECYSGPMEFGPVIGYIASRINGAPMTLDLHGEDGAEYFDLTLDFSGKLRMIDILRCTDAILDQY